uniref:ribonuclease H n=1 Tax=viral metagenome TaxID=1070528 RepID=A0A6C0CL83_9ZZZZ
MKLKEILAILKTKYPDIDVEADAVFVKNCLKNPIQKPTEKIQIYTDGSCHGNPSEKAGWGVWIPALNKEMYGSANCMSTSNRMELTAMIKALEWVLADSSEMPTRVYIIHTDSEYTYNALTRDIPVWKKKGWKKANRQPVKNLEYMTRLDGLMGDLLSKRIDYTIRWIKAHSTSADNNHADALANKGSSA